MQWHHLDYAAVGRYGGTGNEPTIISTAVNGVPQTTVDWFPKWPEPAPAQIRYDAYSSVFTGLSPALPFDDMNVSFTSVVSRNYTGIDQLPSISNGYTLILDFNDDPVGGPAWYEVQLTIDLASDGPLPVSATAPVPITFPDQTGSINSPVIPEPSTILLIGIGIAGLAASKITRRKT